MSDYWKILRILTTNRCNYRCLYCHNEGQEKEKTTKALSFEEFLSVINALDDSGIQEVRFSGGEPLVNPETIKMIEWLDKHSNYEIGLATNGSLVNEDIAKRLGKTRTMVTIHFPAVENSEYQRVTGKDREDFFKAIGFLDKYGVNHSFNFVLYPETIENIEEVVDYVVSSGKRIKLLPYIENEFKNISDKIIEEVSNKMDKAATRKERFDIEGITVWVFENGGKVKLIDSPCYAHNISLCREYGEVRLLPDLSLQKCIFDTDRISIKGLSKDEIRKVFDNQWLLFSKCLIEG